MVYQHPIGAGEMRLSVQQHLKVLESAKEGLEVVYYNSATEPEASLLRREFDAIILHNTFLGFRWTDAFLYTWKQRHDWLRQRDCLKIAMPQDEYDHAELLDEWLLEWGVSHVLTNFGEEHWRALHPLTWDRMNFHRCLTGYIDEESARRWSGRATKDERRTTGIVYRARNLPYWFGSFGQQKHRVAAPVQARAEAMGWTCDISTRNEDAVVGERWLEFLASARAVLGSEGGSSVLDYRGEVRTRIRAMLIEDPALSFEDVDRRMPSGWDSHRFATITPRHFESTITRTCQVLIRGEYDGILEAGRHYIPIDEDLSDLDAALEQLRDDRFVSDIVERTYADVYLSDRWTYRRLAELLREILVAKSEEATNMGGARESNASSGVPPASALERDLIATRHHVALLEAQLLEAHSRLGAAQATQAAAAPTLSALWPALARLGRRRLLIAAAVIAVIWLTAVVGAALLAALIVSARA